MPTLVACATACLVLLVIVALQAPAVSTGLRWEPTPRSGGVPFESFDPLRIEFVGSEEPDFSWLNLVISIVVGILALALLWGILRWLRELLRPAPRIGVAVTESDSSSPTDEPDAEIVQSGLAAALQILTSERNPGNAVVRAWQGLQDAAAAAGLERQASETTSEFTARILYRSRESAEPIAGLLSLYQRVRFGDHSPDASEIAAARASLATLVTLWKTDLPERRPATRTR